MAAEITEVGAAFERHDVGKRGSIHGHPLARIEVEIFAANRSVITSRDGG
jgi:hypothetical protein